MDLWGLESKASCESDNVNNTRTNFINDRAQEVLDIQNLVMGLDMYAHNAGGPSGRTNSIGLTWCNQATFDVANAFGFNQTALYGSSSRMFVTANQAYENLTNAASNGTITEITSRREAQQLANQGFVVIVAQASTSGSGHLSTVVAGIDPDNAETDMQVAHVGDGDSERRTINDSFGVNNEVQFFYDQNQTNTVTGVVTSPVMEFMAQ